MSVVGDVLLEVTGAARVNYAVLGNGDPTLYVHIQPRHAHEDEAKRRGSVELYGDELSLAPFDPERDRPLRWAVYKGLKVRGLCRS